MAESAIHLLVKQVKELLLLAANSQGLVRMPHSELVMLDLAVRKVETELPRQEEALEIAARLAACLTSLHAAIYHSESSDEAEITQGMVEAGDLALAAYGRLLEAMAKAMHDNHGFGVGWTETDVQAEWRRLGFLPDYEPEAGAVGKAIQQLYAAITTIEGLLSTYPDLPGRCILDAILDNHTQVLRALGAPPTEREKP